MGLSMDQDEDMNFEGISNEQSIPLKPLNLLKSESICILEFVFFSTAAIKLNYSMWILILIQIIMLYPTQNEGLVRMAFRSLMMSICKKKSENLP